MKLLFPCYLCPLNLLWFDIQRGHTAIFITCGKCHFHAAISSTYWLCLFKNSNNAWAVGKGHYLVFWGMDDDNFKNNWKMHFTTSVQSENEIWFAVMKAKMQETPGKNACSCRCRLPACTSAARRHSDVCNLCAHPEDSWDTAWARQQPWAQSSSSCGAGWPVWGQPGFQADFMLPNWPAGKDLQLDVTCHEISAGICIEFSGPCVMVLSICCTWNTFIRVIISREALWSSKWE